MPLIRMRRPARMVVGTDRLLTRPSQFRSARVDQVAALNRPMLGRYPVCTIVNA